MLSKEKKYEFRKRLLEIHKKNIRNLSLKPETDEFVIKNGFEILLPENFGDVALTGARDFCDYLFVSMNVSAMIVTKSLENNAAICRIDDKLSEDYLINFAENIEITAKNERALAQAFYCLEDKMNIRKAPFIKKEEIKHTFLFSPRMVHSGYGLDNYPNEHLASIAHAGMDAILVFVKGVNQTPSGFLDFNELIHRAAKYGIDVYAYSYLKSEKHPEEPDAQEFYDGLYGTIFEKCPGFKGVILVGESVGFPSKDENVSLKGSQNDTEGGMPTGKPAPGWWPCYDYPQWLECVKKSIYKHKPDADIVFWTYNWGYVEKEHRLALIRSLPTDISLMVTYEMFHSYELGNIKEFCADYTLSFEGPGEYFVSEAEVAKECGIRLYTMSNTGGMTWDMGCTPYEPMPYQWMKRYNGLREANEKWGLCGLMDSHHYGFWPSFIGDLAKQCFVAENTDMEKCLENVILARFGNADVEKIKSALKCWSEAITHYVPSDADQYGSFRIGPSYPFALIKEIKPQSEPFAHFGNGIVEVMYPADYHPTNRLPTGRGMLPFMRVSEEIKSLETMYELMQKGVEIMEEIKDKNDELLYLLNLGKYICCYVRTGINAKKWYYLSSKLKAEENGENILNLTGKMEELLSEEKKNSEEAINYTNLDSRLGWEPSMDYMGDSEHIEWKLKHLKYIIDFELAIFKRNVNK